MIYDIRHVTTYRYETTVASSRCTLRLLPGNEEGQRVFDSGLDVAPTPAITTERVDFFGTRVITVTIEAPHRELRITALSRVEVERRAAPAAALTPEWEDVRHDAFGSSSLAPSAPAHFLYPSRLVPLHEPATIYARESFEPGRPVVEAAAELMTRIRDDFKYDPKATAVTTPLSEAFEARGGVCQDFAHIMIAGLRGLGLPAAYVSGYIRTLPPPGKPRLVGADASHAWVSLWCGPSFGWIDFDPTNAVIASNDHIVIARGRDYADVSPIDGVIRGSGKQKLSVSVDVAPSQRKAGDPPARLLELV
ncbi:MAG: transglutaminase family protein [Hyphomicrobiales bacterium]|nr:transglutaminase family protein [Hyphomicrobiales bacterium]